jgi:hypothetical protein
LLVLSFYDDLELRKENVLRRSTTIWSGQIAEKNARTVAGKTVSRRAGRNGNGDERETVRSDKVMELSAGFFLSAAGATSGLVWRTAALRNRKSKHR